MRRCASVGGCVPPVGDTASQHCLRLAQRWAALNPVSRKSFERARRSLPGGLAHDVRRADPFPVSVVRADGARKWDADGHELIDYVMGHGSLLFGHGYGPVVQAVRRQAEIALHPGACHAAEAAWAELVVDLVPSAELVRFTSSGTEATLLAMQVARAWTGRDRVLKLAGHFHGWHDAASIAVDPPFDVWPAGIPRAVDRFVVVCPPELGAIERALGAGDIAAVMLEPSGAAWGTVGLASGFLERLRALTQKHGSLLVYDEIVTGFRWSPGGVQGVTSVLPDLTTLAKILAGGLPGGAVCGRSDVMELLAFGDAGSTKVAHPGTHNAHPLAAAAGCATLRACADGAVQRDLASRGQQLRDALNDVLARRGVAGAAYGESSSFHLVFDEAASPGDVSAVSADVLKLGVTGGTSIELHCGMLLRGVHLFHGSGFLCPGHGAAELERTARAFDETLADLLEEGLVPA
ncbi:MAG TPA: aminotransferase class III-fold pyridoxal phosphate-dependent enzyme [Solirubrobacteraceae bacterium]|nr:aminotransferase class III-fold pyridoxal phosphate-dependent enzyme [Solirubrobacteraceae bacterium]